jgi:nicotinamidase-related amidase
VAQQELFPRDFAGQPGGGVVLLSVDIQGHPGAMPGTAGIPHMGGFAGLVSNAEKLVAAARANGVPVIFFQEVHRAGGLDIGRETDGAEDMHCVEGDLATGLWPTLTPEPGEPHLVKRRYSCFIGTELEILLRAYRASTLVLMGGLTDVCVHYTFADAHQRDYYVRVAEDAVAGSSRPAHDAALAAMEYLQSGARRTTQEIVEAFEALGRQHSEVPATRTTSDTPSLAPTPLGAPA